MVRMPVYSGSLIDWIWFPLEPSVQGRKYQTAQAGDLLIFLVSISRALSIFPHVFVVSLLLTGAQGGIRHGDYIAGLKFG